MRRSRILLDLSLLFLATLLGWCFRGVFDEIMRGHSSAPAQAGNYLRKTGGGQPESLPTRALHDNSAGAEAVSTGARSAQGAPRPDALSSPVAVMPPEVQPGNAEFSQNGATLLHVRPQPEIAPSQPSSAAVLPPGVQPGDVSWSQNGATLLHVRPQPPAMDSRSPLIASPPEPENQAGSPSPERMIPQKPPPDGKAPANPPTSKQPKK